MTLEGLLIHPNQTFVSESNHYYIRSGQPLFYFEIIIASCNFSKAFIKSVNNFLFSSRDTQASNRNGQSEWKSACGCRFCRFQWTSYCSSISCRKGASPRLIVISELTPWGNVPNDKSWVVYKLARFECDLIMLTLSNMAD